MWAIEDSSGPKAAYRGGWYHFTSGYTTSLTKLPVWKQRKTDCHISNRLNVDAILITDLAPPVACSSVACDMPASHSDCRQGIHGDRLPVAGYGYTSSLEIRVGS